MKALGVSEEKIGSGQCSVLTRPGSAAFRYLRFLARTQCAICRAIPTVHGSGVIGRLYEVGFIFLRNGGKTHNLPVLLLHYVPDQIIFVQTLHDNDDSAILLVIQATVEGVVEPATSATRRRHGQGGVLQDLRPWGTAFQV